MGIKLVLKALRDCNFFAFIKYNYISTNVVRKKGAYLYPYRGSIIQIAKGAKLELGGNFLFNAGKYRGSRAESYLILDENSKLTVSGNSRINYASTIHVNKDGELNIGSITTNVGINFQVKKKVCIGMDCMFGRNTTIFDSSFHPTGYSKELMDINSEEVIIGNHVWIGAYAFIMQGTDIGDGSIVGSKVYIRGKIAPASTILATIDEPVSSGMIWARSMIQQDIDAAVNYYKDDNEKPLISDEAVEMYSRRVVNALSKVLNYIDFENERTITESGRIDSLGMVKAVTALCNEFDITIPYYEIKPENFNNKDTMASLVWRIKHSQNESDEFIVPDKTLPKVSIVEQISINAKKYPNKIAVVSEGREYTYDEFFGLIKGYCNYLKGLGLSRGDMILAKSNQSVNYIVTYFATHLAGMEITTVDQRASKATLYNMAEIVRAKAISTERSEHDDDSRYIYIDSLNVLGNVSDKSGKMIFPNEYDKAEILFSTGTTGVSKGIELSHKAVVCGAENMAVGAHMARHTVLICPNPLSHSNAIKQLAATMISGGTFIVLDGITDLNALFEAMNYQSNKVSIVLPPSGIRTILQLAKDDFGSFANRIEYVMVATAPLPEPDREVLRKMFPNSRLYNHYGCSESSTICIYDFNKHKNQKNCVGIVTENTEVMFVDENRNVIESSKENMGLLAVSGGAVMEGYYNDTEHTADILIDGVIYTNDIGYIDENGFVFIIGRNDDVINVGGLKVAPTEVESVALELEFISDCVCIGVEDEMSGHALKLLYISTNDAPIDTKTIVEYLSGVLEPYKVPHIFEEVDHIERTYNGKINRKAYR